MWTNCKNSCIKSATSRTCGSVTRLEITWTRLVSQRLSFRVNVQIPRFPQNFIDSIKFELRWNSFSRFFDFQSSWEPQNWGNLLPNLCNLWHLLNWCLVLGLPTMYKYRELCNKLILFHGSGIDSQIIDLRVGIVNYFPFTFSSAFEPENKWNGTWMFNNCWKCFKFR